MDQYCGEDYNISRLLCGSYFKICEVTHLMLSLLIGLNIKLCINKFNYIQNSRPNIKFVYNVYKYIYLGHKIKIIADKIFVCSVVILNLSLKTILSLIIPNCFVYENF